MGRVHGKRVWEGRVEGRAEGVGRWGRTGALRRGFLEGCATYY